MERDHAVEALDPNHNLAFAALIGVVEPPLGGFMRGIRRAGSAHDLAGPRLLVRSESIGLNDRFDARPEAVLVNPFGLAWRVVR